ncbi:metallophosphoesterase family protein [Neolewinella aurantiaca]|nr:metallophosphoesterase family protein [Neolewinella aurantiaca]
MRYAISDIHGCPKSFRALLNEIQLDRNDELFLLGDYIDRGPDSQGVIDLAWELEADGYNVKSLRGNHEEMLLEAHRGERDVYDWAPSRKHYDKVIAWMDRLPFYFETPGYILVHAGLNFQRTFPFKDKNAMLYSRYFYDTIDYEWLGDRIIVHGHTPARMLEVKKDIRDMATNQYACIDAGCSQVAEGMGYLTALNLDTKEGTFVRSQD